MKSSSGFIRALLCNPWARLVGLLLALPSVLLAELRVASPFGDHMVLQRDLPLPVWGTATPGDKVSVAFAGQKRTVTAGPDGKWRVELKKLKVSTQPREFVVTAVNRSAKAETRKFTDVLVGEVWLCGGQSNMERQLGLRSGQKPIVNWEAEVAAAQYPLIRQLYVAQTRAVTPQDTVTATWTVCSPATSADFSAVGYFFARDLHAALGVPVGIIHSSWGGTPSEAWTSREGLQGFPEFAEALGTLQQQQANAAEAKKAYAAKLARWFAANDPGSGTVPWQSPGLITTAWETMKLPVLWEEAGHANFDGVAWFRKSFDVPAAWAGRDLELNLGAIDDVDTTWVNGTEVGATSGWNVPRVYRISAAALRPTGNIIAVRVLDTAGGGGLWDPRLPLSVAPVGLSAPPLSLNGPWQARFGSELTATNRPPVDNTQNSGAPTGLYNGMIAPLIPYALRGVAFYQGEANASRARQYRTLFPALIADWRQRWGQGDFPFLFVQIAPYRGQPPEIREAQLIAWQNTRNTAMVVTLDVGDAQDIHPADKGPVGARLALAARAVAYGEKLTYSGPVYNKLTIQGDKAVLSFTHVGDGLVADGPLEGFTLAGADGVFRPAQAEVVGQTVVVYTPAVPAPVAVRYGWANIAEGNLFNQAGLPATPFRTDID